MTLYLVFAFVAFVAAFGIACYVGIPSILAEVEAERTDVARAGSRCGLHPRS